MQLGWLSAVPEGNAGHEGAKKSSWEMTRRQYLIKTTGHAPVPEIGAGDGVHLIEMLFEIGPTAIEPTTGDEIPINFADIHHANLCLGLDLEAAEARAIKDLSEAYLRGKRDGMVPRNMIPPMEREQIE